MKFDKSKVYNAVNADELEEGDVVFAADTLADLQRYVVAIEGNVYEISNINMPTEEYRFLVNESAFALTYLIAKHNDPYKEFKKAQAEGKKVWFKYDNGVWHTGNDGCDFSYPVDRYSLTNPTAEYKVFLDDHFVFGIDVPKWAKHIYFISTDIRTASKWCTEHNKFAEIAKAWEEGKEIQYLNKNIWLDCVVLPVWDVNVEYRIKPVPLKWTDLKCGAVITDGTRISIVTCVDPSDSRLHIFAGLWLTDGELSAKWTKV